MAVTLDGLCSIQSYDSYCYKNILFLASLSGTNKRDGLLINFPKNSTSILFYGWLKQVVNIPTNVAEVDEGAIAH